MVFDLFPNPVLKIFYAIWSPHQHDLTDQADLDFFTSAMMLSKLSPCMFIESFVESPSLLSKALIILQP